jgi:hypothetical protein
LCLSINCCLQISKAEERLPTKSSSSPGNLFLRSEKSKYKLLLATRTAGRCINIMHTGDSPLKIFRRKMARRIPLIWWGRRIAARIPQAQSPGGAVALRLLYWLHQNQLTQTPPTTGPITHLILTHVPRLSNSTRPKLAMHCASTRLVRTDIDLHVFNS